MYLNRNPLQDSGLRILECLDYPFYTDTSAMQLDIFEFWGLGKVEGGGYCVPIYACIGDNSKVPTKDKPVETHPNRNTSC